jgi:hypothetical protein
MNQTLGAYYQCHKNAASFIRTIKSFKKFYPESDIVITNDGGYDYQYFCNNNNITYSYISKTTEINQQALIFTSFEPCLLFLKNLFDSFKNIKETHILLLEDDVRVLKMHTTPFLSTINGCNKNETLHPVLINILKEKGYNGPFFYGACGGCVIDKQFFQNIDFKEIEKLLYKIKDIPQVFASDILISFITLYFGGTIEQYDEFAELWYSDIQEKLSNNLIAFLHQYKYHYEKYGIFPNKDELLELYGK